MAKDEPNEEAEASGTETPVPAPPPNKRKKLIAIAATAALVVAGGGGAAWFFAKGASGKKAGATASAEGEHAEEHPEGEPAAHATPAGAPQYLSLTPAFVVNLADTDAIRYLQVDIELMSHDAPALESVKVAMPLIRNNLLLLMGQQHVKDIETREGKEKLQAAALAEVQRIVAEQGGSGQGVEALYFTSFVMQ